MPAEVTKEQIEGYLRDRLDQYIGWYDSKSVKMKRYYMRTRIWSAVAAVLIPVISNTTFPVPVFSTTIDLSKIAVTLLGLVVALLVALEGVLHHREQWQNYRTTEQYLQAQKYLFMNRVAEYSGLDDADGFRLLVRNVEAAIKTENEVTLNVMSRSEAASAK